MRPYGARREQLDALEKVLSRENFQAIPEVLFGGMRGDRIDSAVKALLTNQAKQLDANKVLNMITALEQKAASMEMRALMAEKRFHGPSKQSAKLRMRVNDITRLVHSMAYANEEIKSLLEQTPETEILHSEAA